MVFGFKKLTSREKESSINKIIVNDLLAIILLLLGVSRMSGAEIAVTMNGKEILFSIPQLPEYMVVLFMLGAVYFYYSYIWNAIVNRIWGGVKTIVQVARVDSPYKNHPELLPQKQK